MSRALLREFAAHLSETIRVVDVGARWGVGEQWEPLGDTVEVFGFDPDAAECERLNGLAPKNVRYIPLALGESKRTATLHVTTEPACSSLYSPIAALGERVPELACTTPATLATIDLCTLDDWQRDNSIGAVTFMKLDTQGSELGVLQGAERALRDVQLLEVEVEFNPLYEGQPLLGDVDRHLRERGFVLWRLSNETHYSSEPVPSANSRMREMSYFDSRPLEGERGAGQLYWGDAYYARAELSPASNQAVDEDQAVRAACVALACGLDDLAKEVVRKGGAPAGKLLSQ